MPKETEPNPKAEVLKSSKYSPMQYMKEYLIHDKERDGLVRFRGRFIMPDWSGVEEEEFDYIVKSPDVRLDIIANEYYGEPQLKWVIAARNKIDIPDVQLYKGRQLKIPARDWVERILLPQGIKLRKSSQ